KDGWDVASLTQLLDDTRPDALIIDKDKKPQWKHA
ncbi:hypothetical protein PSYMO_38153, partial [Pseudomonas amygdali pv. mori str. 301020]